MLLVLDHLTAGYGDRVIVRDFDIQVAAGDFVLMIGANGAGKSTIFKALYGQAKVFALRRGALLDGPARLPFDRQATRGRIGYVPQYGNVFRSMTLRENIQLVAAGDPLVCREGFELIKRYAPELHRQLASPVAHLSGGQRQILAIILGVLLKPELLLLDEPLAGLDARAVDRVVTLMEELAGDARLGMVVVEHRYSRILHLADHLIGMRMGARALDIPDMRNTPPRDVAERIQTLFFGDPAFTP